MSELRTCALHGGFNDCVSAEATKESINEDAEVPKTAKRKAVDDGDDYTAHDFDYDFASDFAPGFTNDFADDQTDTVRPAKKARVIKSNGSDEEDTAAVTASATNGPQYSVPNGLAEIYQPAQRRARIGESLMPRTLLPSCASLIRAVDSIHASERFLESLRNAPSTRPSDSGPLLYQAFDGDFAFLQPPQRVDASDWGMTMSDAGYDSMSMRPDTGLEMSRGRYTHNDEKPMAIDTDFAVSPRADNIRSSGPRHQVSLALPPGIFDIDELDPDTPIPSIEGQDLPEFPGADEEQVDDEHLRELEEELADVETRRDYIKRLIAARKEQLSLEQDTFQSEDNQDNTVSSEEPEEQQYYQPSESGRVTSPSPSPSPEIELPERENLLTGCFGGVELFEGPGSDELTHKMNRSITVETFRGQPLEDNVDRFSETSELEELPFGQTEAVGVDWVRRAEVNMLYPAPDIDSSDFGMSGNPTSSGPVILDGEFWDFVRLQRWEYSHEER